MELSRLLSEGHYEVRSYERGELDITRAEAVEKAISADDPGVVFNAAAYNQVDLAEQEPQVALQVNALGVRNLALVCRQLDAALVHFSTDYVFDGTAGRAYVEEDIPRPLGAYAISKLAGEHCALAYVERALVLRTSGVFGPGGLHTARGNFVELMLRLARAGQPIRVVDDHVASPTYAPALAERAIRLYEAGHQGVFHLGGGQAISWYSYARMIFNAAGLEPELRPTSEREYRTAARRPRYSALSNLKMEKAGVPAMPSLDAALRDYFEHRQRLAGASAK